MGNVTVGEKSRLRMGNTSFGKIFTVNGKCKLIFSLGEVLLINVEEIDCPECKDDMLTALVWLKQLDFFVVIMKTLRSTSGRSTTCVRTENVPILSLHTPSDPKSTSKLTRQTTTPGLCQNHKQSRPEQSRWISS
jgi:hypothetical protein